MATAAFGDHDAPEVVFLRAFRDVSLVKNSSGRTFIRAFSTSLTIAGVVAQSAMLRVLVRNVVLRPIIEGIRRYQE